MAGYRADKGYWAPDHFGWADFPKQKESSSAGASKCRVPATRFRSSTRVKQSVRMTAHGVRR
jgi:hypothetical protein